jgi:outer membrane protein
MRLIGTSLPLRPALRTLTIALLAAVGAAALAPAASAQATGSKFRVPTVAVVNEEGVIGASIAVKDIRAQIDKQRVSYQQELSVKDEELHQMELALQAQGPSLSPEALAQRQQELSVKAQAAQALLQDHQSKLTAAFEQAMLQVQGMAKQVVDQIAVEDHISLVLPTTTAIESLPSMDITAEVIKRLNARLTAVAVRMPQ